MKLRIGLVVVFVMLGPSVFVSAHCAPLDQKGGHYDEFRGFYHYHPPFISCDQEEIKNPQRIIIRELPQPAEINPPQSPVSNELLLS